MKLTQKILNTLVGTDMTVEERNHTVHQLAANTFKYLYIVSSLPTEKVICCAYAMSVNSLIETLAECQQIKSYMKNDLIEEIRQYKKASDRLGQIIRNRQPAEKDEEEEETEEEFTLSFLVDLVGMDVIEECTEEQNITDVKGAIEKLNSTENSDNLKMFIVMLDHCPKLRVALVKGLIECEDVGLDVEQVDLEKIVY